MEILDAITRTIVFFLFLIAALLAPELYIQLALGGFAFAALTW